VLLGCGVLRGKGSGAPAPGRCVVARFALSFSMTLVLANSLGWHGCSLRSVPTPCSFDRNVSAALRSLVGWIIPVKQPGFKTDGSGVDWRRGRQPAEVLVGRALSGLLRARQPVGAGGDRGLPQQQQRTAFSQKTHTPTVPKELQIGLYDPAEADLEHFWNCCSAGLLGERLYGKHNAPQKEDVAPRLWTEF